MIEAATWRKLCGKAVALCGNQQAFQQQARILKRLVEQFGAADTERMIAGAQALGWDNLRSLGSKNGLGRRWALEKFWDTQKRGPGKLPEDVKTILRGMLK